MIGLIPFMVCGWIAIVASAVAAILAPFFLVAQFRAPARWWRTRPRTVAAWSGGSDRELISTAHLKSIRRRTVMWSKTFVIPGLIGGIALTIFGIGLVLVVPSLVAYSAIRNMGAGTPISPGRARFPFVYASVMAMAGVGLWIALAVPGLADIPAYWQWLVVAPWLVASCVVGWQLMVLNELNRLDGLVVADDSLPPLGIFEPPVDAYEALLAHPERDAGPHRQAPPA